MDLSLTSSNEYILDKLSQFNSQYVSPSNRVDLSPGDQQSFLEFCLDSILTDESKQECFSPALTAVKILSRNKSTVNSVLTSGHLEILLSHAGLMGDKSKANRDDIDNRNLEGIGEALRCLSNIYLQSSCAQNYGVENSTIPSVIEQTKKYKELDLPHEIMSSDLKLVFLITAHRPEARSVVRVHHRGLSRLTDVLRLMLTNAKDRSQACAAKISTPSFSDEEVMVILDVLRVLFNLTIGNEMNQSCNDEEEMSELIELAKLISIFFTMSTSSQEKKPQLVSNCINLLTNYPLDCLEPLRAPLSVEYTDVALVEYDGTCMNPVATVLNYLSTILDNSRLSVDLRDNATPALKVLVCLAKSHRLIRRYLRFTILPPLKGADIKNRPEEGSTMRNKLCRLLTSPDTSVSTMAAELLFILCKEKVGRFVKHTGYGNAAGLLARRGLMMGGKGDNDYSATDEDSDTEEYSEKAHLVDPITGCVKSPIRENPFEGMSEEQKEYEAVKLANLIDKLHNMGVMKPARIDEFGRPTEVDHVLQLIEEPDAAIRHLESESDSD